MFLQVRSMLLYNQACKFFHIKTPLFLQRLILSFCLLLLHFHLSVGYFSERHNSAYSVLETSIFQISTRNSIFFCWSNRFSTKLSEAKLPPKGLWRSFAMLTQQDKLYSGHYPCKYLNIKKKTQHNSHLFFFWEDIIGLLPFYCHEHVFHRRCRKLSSWRLLLKSTSQAWLLIIYAWWKRKKA